MLRASAEFLVAGIEASALAIPASAVVVVGHGGVAVGPIQRSRIYEVELLGSEPVLSAADQATSLESVALKFYAGATPSPVALTPPARLVGYQAQAQATGLTALGTNNVMVSPRLRLRCDDLLDTLGLAGTLTLQVSTAWYNSSATSASLTTYGTLWRVRWFDYDALPAPSA